jgi:hypothetical protein
MPRSSAQPAAGDGDAVDAFERLATALRESDPAAFDEADYVADWLRWHRSLAAKCVPNPMDRTRNPATTFKAAVATWRSSANFDALREATFGVAPHAETWNDGLWVRLCNLIREVRSHSPRASQSDATDLQIAFGFLDRAYEAPTSFEWQDLSKPPPASPRSP